MSTKEGTRSKEIPAAKKETVDMLVKKINDSKTVFISSIKGLPASQFQQIKSKLRGKADVLVAKKSLVKLAFEKSGKAPLKELEQKVGADVALMFSNLDAFELAGILIDRQSPAKAKVGDELPADIEVEEGPTELVPGPAISELGAVGLKVAVEGGKLAIKQKATIGKKGDKVDDKLSNVMGKLNILPMKVGFLPVAAYDSESDSVYLEITIDKKGTLEALREAIGKSFGFAVNVGYFSEQTVKYFIAKAGIEEKALATKLGSGEEKKEDAPSEEEKKEETQTDSNNDKEESA